MPRSMGYRGRTALTFLACVPKGGMPGMYSSRPVKASPLSHTLQDILYKIERRVVGPVHVLEENTVVHSAC